MNLYPLFLKLKKSPCLVIGGGRVAERKVEKLLDSEADVTVLAPNLTEKLQYLTNRNKIKYLKQDYKSGKLKNYFLVIASTNSNKINEMIYKEAMENNVLINSVDNPENCNFYVPASIIRDDLQIAISSSGSVPYFTKKLRKFLEQKLYTELGEEVKNLSILRKKIIKEAAGNNKIKEQKFTDILDPEINKIFRKIDGK